MYIDPMTTTRQHRPARKAFRVQTLNTVTGNPGGSLRVLAANAAAARAKFAVECPEATIHTIKPWASNR